jgi:hypothetical protein
LLVDVKPLQDVLPGLYRVCVEQLPKQCPIRARGVLLCCSAHFTFFASPAGTDASFCQGDVSQLAKFFELSAEVFRLACQESAAAAALAAAAPALAQAKRLKVR